MQIYDDEGNALPDVQLMSGEGGGAGIEGVVVDEVNNADAPAYNIAGQRVNKNAKGIVIINGKKYINK